MGEIQCACLRHPRTRSTAGPPGKALSRISSGWTSPARHQSSLDLFDLRTRDVAVGAALEIRVQIVDVVHHRLAGRETDHPFIEATVAHRLDEIVLAQSLQAFDERRADHAFLVGAMATVACAGAPGA